MPEKCKRGRNCSKNYYLLLLYPPGIHQVTEKSQTVTSVTPPYDHPVYTTTSLLRPYSFKPNVKTIESFYYFDDPVNATTSLLRPGFYGPTVVALTGFHCNSLDAKIEREKKPLNRFFPCQHFLLQALTLTLTVLLFYSLRSSAWKKELQSTPGNSNPLYWTRTSR